MNTRGTADITPEHALRVDLAAAYRTVALEGGDDGVFNHFSAAVPGTEGEFLLKPFGPLFEEVTASGLIRVDLAGRIVAGQGMWEPTAFHIHARIHAGVPRARCVMHTHMPYATALTSLVDMRILPITQSAMRFVGRVGYLEEYEGLVLDEDAALRLVAAHRDHDVVLMASHGVSVIGRDVAACLYDLHYLEIAARDQYLARTMGAPLRAVAPDVVARAVGQMVTERETSAAVHLAAMKRRLDRLLPGYAA
ncbi:class II aldolase/adducin family protein [Komagataeibacter saccharivorans]|uniref:class II aldolase/adducin family protein n=1 Tax=Komagataeibacter saccharivorans TaxID=265959 RepID=UPI000C831030|nr:class II aldolase/adducin family protein [Komagataeibacter saccharivorans]